MMMVINTMRHLDCPVNYCSDWNEIRMRAYNRGKEGGYGTSNRVKSYPFKTQSLHVPPSSILKDYFTHMELIYSPLFSYDFDKEQRIFPLIWWFLLTQSCEK